MINDLTLRRIGHAVQLATWAGLPAAGREFAQIWVELGGDEHGQLIRKGLPQVAEQLHRTR